jgi:hypothetical protein
MSIAPRRECPGRAAIALSRGLHRLDMAKVPLFDPHTAAVGGRTRAEVRADG